MMHVLCNDNEKNFAHAYEKIDTERNEETDDRDTGGVCVCYGCMCQPPTTINLQPTT